MAGSPFQKVAGDIAFRRISFCIVVNGLERGWELITAIISADEGKRMVLETLVRKRNRTEPPRAIRNMGRK